jgi:CheY-like chemotaxis protein
VGGVSAPSVLVIEDNPQTRKLLRITLESHGCVVREAEDATTALRSLDPAPDVIVQDLLLPDMDGFTLLRRMRAQPDIAATPIIAVSGFAQQLFGADADAAGFAERLCKPVEPSRLLAALQPHLDAAGPDVAPVTGGRRVLLADDSPIQRKLAAQRLRDAG